MPYKMVYGNLLYVFNFFQQHIEDFKSMEKIYKNRLKNEEKKNSIGINESNLNFNNEKRRRPTATKKDMEKRLKQGFVFVFC